jgi:hypothetical protein
MNPVTEKPTRPLRPMNDARRKLLADIDGDPVQRARRWEPFTPEGRQLILEWERNGGYEAAVARVIADDPDLRSE